LKLSYIPDRSTVRGAVVAISAALGACASTPSQPVVERLDPDTATTLAVINTPVELLSESGRGATGDPFAYIAPFETNQMGKRALFLWMSAPAPEGTKLDPQLLCDGQPLALQPVDDDSARLGLSHAPYAPPAPWSLHWYVQLPPDALKCLASAQTITLETRTVTGGEPERFTVSGKSLAALRAFSSR
jgi:hypothetical protein